MYVDRRRNGNCYYLQQVKIKINVKLYVIATDLRFSHSVEHILNVLCLAVHNRT
jgi:hypothetical protein